MNKTIYFIPKDELRHYGVKGMKWGVRRTKEELAKARAKSAEKTLSVNKTISGHSPSPKKSDPNDIIDHVDEDGTIDSRSFYDENGWKIRDIHTKSHGNPKQHPYGQKGEHVDEYEWDEDGRLKNRTRRDLTDDERKENADIL